MGDEHSDEKETWLDLSLSLRVSNSIPPSPTPLTIPSSPFTFRTIQSNGNGIHGSISHLSDPSFDYLTDRSSTMMSHRPITRSRRNSVANPSTDETQDYVEDMIEPPFPWATTRPAGIHALPHLTSVGINYVVGEFMCRRCDRVESFSYDLCSKFQEVDRFIITHSHIMHDRAPPEWMNPVFPDCVGCGQNGLRPVLADRNEMINWLFLFLGQMLGVCTLEQLKWFCKHTENHRTGAKDRVLYLSYIAICMQLQPDGGFEYLINTTNS